jgi:hypothetical protein
MLAPETVLLRALVCLQSARALAHMHNSLTHAHTHSYTHTHTHTHTYIHFYTRTNHMQMKKGTIRTIERQKKFSMRIVFVFLVVAIISFLVDVSRGSYGASHHSIMFNPFNTSGSDNSLAAAVTFFLHVVILMAFYLSSLSFKAVVHPLNDKESSFTKCYRRVSVFITAAITKRFQSSYTCFLDCAIIPECEIGEDYELERQTEKMMRQRWRLAEELEERNHKDDAAAVEVSGATGPTAAHINGVYRPVAGEGVGGKPVYKKDGADTRIEYGPDKDQWRLKPASSKEPDAAYMHSLGTQKEAGVVEEVTGGWNVYDSTTKVWSVQAGVRVVRLPGEAPVCVFRMLL